VTITILTLFPGIFSGYLEASILARAISRGLVTVKVVDIREYAADRHHVCDDAAYGGGPGMVMKPEPIAAALEATTAAGARVIYLTPSGRLFSQRAAEELAGGAEFTLLCGRYEGVDQRVIDSFVTEEFSIGDYVLSGGEVAAMAVVDSVTRLVPGVITGESLEEESFSEGLLEYPHYTRPEVFRGMRVPEVLLSGHHEKIRQWRLLRSVEKTLKYRPELLASDRLSREAKDLAGQLRREGDSHGRDEGA
jgi:tRNA (guanine37-N1)-methyltransferase